MNIIQVGTGLGITTILVLSIMSYNTWTLGGILGAEASINESESLNSVEDELLVAESEAISNLEENDTADIPFAPGMTTSDVVRAGMDVARSGVYWGYDNPELAEWNARVSPLVTLIQFLGAILYIFGNKVTEEIL